MSDSENVAEVSPQEEPNAEPHTEEEDVQQVVEEEREEQVQLQEEEKEQVGIEIEEPTSGDEEGGGSGGGAVVVDEAKDEAKEGGGDEIPAEEKVELDGGEEKLEIGEAGVEKNVGVGIETPAEEKEEAKDGEEPVTEETKQEDVIVLDTKPTTKAELKPTTKQPTKQAKHTTLFPFKKQVDAVTLTAENWQLNPTEKLQKRYFEVRENGVNPSPEQVLELARVVREAK